MILMVVKDDAIRTPQLTKARCTYVLTIVPGLVATSCCTFLDRDIHTLFLRMAMVIISTIDVVVSWSESHTLGILRPFQPTSSNHFRIRSQQRPDSDVQGET